MRLSILLAGVLLAGLLAACAGPRDEWDDSVPRVESNNEAMMEEEGEFVTEEMER